MPLNATPMSLADNLFETVALYPGHIVTASGEVAGHEIWFAFDGLRDLTSWQTPFRVQDELATVQCGVARTANTIFLDRGHNYDGETVHVETAPDGAAWVTRLTALVGTDGHATAEGAWWHTFADQTDTWWRLRIAAPGAARSLITTGVFLGTRLEFKNYLHRPVDSDRRRMYWQERRTPGGVRVRDQAVRHRVLDDRVTLYDEPEYVAGVRKWVTQVADGGVPFWWVLDQTNAPDEAWQFLNMATDVAWPFEQAKGRTGRVVAEENIPLRQLIYL